MPCSANPAQPHSGANIVSLKAPAQCYTASFAFSSEAKASYANSASPCEAQSYSEAILTSPETKKKAFKARRRVFQPKRATIQSPQVSVLDRLGPVNTDMRVYLNNKKKFRSEEPVHISPSQYRQAGYQLMIVHSVHCCLGLLPTPSTQ